MLKICDNYTKDIENYPKIAKQINGSFCDLGLLNYSFSERINKDSPRSKPEDEKEMMSNEIPRSFFLAHYLMNLSFRTIAESTTQLWQEYRIRKENKYISFIYSQYVYTFSNQFMQNLSDFLSFSSFTLLSSIQPPKTTLQEYLVKEYCLPTDYIPPPSFGILPEHIITNIHNALDFYSSHYEENFFKFNPLYTELIVKLYITLICLPYQTNVHSRASLTYLFGAIAYNRENKGPIDIIDEISEDKFFSQNISQAIVKGFVFVEKTGAHNQFHDKFNYRRYLLKTLQILWKKSNAKKLI